MKSLLIGLVMGFLSIVPALAETREYHQGTLNVKCSCKNLNVERTSWHHVIKVPPAGLKIDLNDVCKTTRNNYDGADVTCFDGDDYVGEEYSFDASE